MKVGDNVYCKNSFKNLFYINCSYIVKGFNDSGIMIYFTHNNGWTTFTIGEKHTLYSNFEDYFYTEKEIRKMKLIEIEK